MDPAECPEEENVFDILDLDDEPSFNSMDLVVSNMAIHIMEDSPLEIPSYPQEGTSNGSNDSNCSSQLVILDPSPPGTPTASPTPSVDHDYTESIALDLEHVLSFKDSDYKSVKLRLSAHTVPYNVSMDLDQSTLRLPPKRHDLALRLPQNSATAEEMLECSEMLQLAVTRNTVHDTPSESKSEDEARPTSPSAAENLIDLHLFSVATQRTATAQLIRLYLEQNLSMASDAQNTVHFDRIAVTESNQKRVLLDSTPLTEGYHEWSVQVWRCDVDLQEIGVVSVRDIDQIPVSSLGAWDTEAFGSRALYGSEMSSGLLFYGSFNSDGKKRCHRDLSPFFNVGWCAGDVITVQLDLDRWRIKYLLNGKAVRYTMSLESNRQYHRVIAFEGNCKYFLH